MPNTPAPPPAASVQQYIDRLKNELAQAEASLTAAQKTQTQLQNQLDRQGQWSALLQQLLGMIQQTNGLGITYMATLQRARYQADRVGNNTHLGLQALKLLICETKQVADCTEVLRALVKQLTDRTSSCTITSTRDKAQTIMTAISTLKTNLDAAMIAVVAAVNALLTALQSQEAVWVAITGERGLSYQVNAMWQHMSTGKKQDLEDCANCQPKKLPVFPMDDPECDFFTKTQNQYTDVTALIETLKDKLAEATCKAEAALSKRDAMAAAYAAALAAKACDSSTPAK